MYKCGVDFGSGAFSQGMIQRDPANYPQPILAQGGNDFIVGINNFNPMLYDPTLRVRQPVDNGNANFTNIDVNDGNYTKDLYTKAINYMNMPTGITDIFIAGMKMVCAVGICVLSAGSINTKLQP